MFEMYHTFVTYTLGRVKNMEKVKYHIPQSFLIGASAAAWQTEGWTGKKAGQDSLLDAAYKFSPERWHNGYGPAIATDFYNRYKEDCALMQDIGLKAFRTSLDWSRFIKDYETGEVDEEAAAYYSSLVDELIAKGVEPLICLEHWELPNALYEAYGGWGSKHVVDLYVKFAAAAFQLLGDRVKYWVTFNEPIVFPSLAIMDALWYPYKADTKLAMQWNYNKVLAGAKAIQLYHSKNYNGKIGICLNSAVVYSRSAAPDDQKAAKICDLFNNAIYADPCIKGEYSPELISLLQEHDCMFDTKPEELAVIQENTIDFLGLNYYTPTRVKAPTGINPQLAFNPGQYYENYDMPGKKFNPSRGWEIYAKGLYDYALRIKNEYGNIPWLVTENGMGVSEEGRYKAGTGVVQDDYRIDFVADHLRWLLKAVAGGSNCFGYLMWSFTDNVSPYNAFKNRYGFVEIDLENDRQRRVKKSGNWIKEVIRQGYFVYDSFTPEYK
jgi:beta-glucosidase/6-phospho-beta-glucosidase/beta-galactosidase